MEMMEAGWTGLLSSGAPFVHSNGDNLQKGHRSSGNPEGQLGPGFQATPPIKLAVRPGPHTPAPRANLTQVLVAFNPREVPMRPPFPTTCLWSNADPEALQDFWTLWPTDHR